MLNNYTSLFIGRIRQITLVLFFALSCLLAVAQAPVGYYDGTQGLYGEALKEALHNIIKDHSPRTYSQLWQDFYATDRKANGKVWDMYSDVPGGTPPYEYTFFTDQCGNYSQEGDCYNREHTWPTSWFGGNVMPMHTDLYHIVPTDGFVNNRRANFPYGEVNNPSWVSANGAKLGPNVTPGYTGVVFEPIDAYKGDFARGMLYMTVRYYGLGNNWPGSDMTAGAELLPWALDLMLQWHEQDPVSQKEIERNDAVYALQNNRNPFIDNPDFAFLIWDETAAVSSTAAPLFTVYPNPGCGMINISFEKPDISSPLTVVIHDLSAREFLRFEGLTGNHISFQEELLPVGFYILHVYTENERLSTVKYIKNHLSCH